MIRSLVAPCYSKPSFSSAKITEAVFGETVEVLEVKDSWIHIKQKDDYKSWLKSFYGTFEENPIECDYIVIDKYPLLFGNKIFKKINHIRPLMVIIITLEKANKDWRSK